ncbi:phosphatase PAP2 family protein [Thiothrix subterranea]|uniref:phosphatase PAP2 family protein n=1 Tax=Thiothrix subterranea TaxID=2735563 RepID=UPI00280ABF76|nr:phosphatase PAP2 family protein [Thiothrix subterranea]
MAFWFLWRERKPQWARLALAFSVTLGAVIGVTRMAAGGHFLSDVMWSAWVVLFAAWLLYYPLMRMAERDPLDKA